MYDVTSMGKKLRYTSRLPTLWFPFMSKVSIGKENNDPDE